MLASAWWQSAAGVFLAGTTAFVADMALGEHTLKGIAGQWHIYTARAA
jgi:hypothetical protein